MTLDEAIKHCEEVADLKGCSKCGKQHRQLASWLSELKEYRKVGMAIGLAGLMTTNERRKICDK